jgi:hypothetical protein
MPALAWYCEQDSGHATAKVLEWGLMPRQVLLGDRVRILVDPATVNGCWASREGTCCGFVTPSISKVAIVGTADRDLAVKVMFRDGEIAAFAVNLVAFVDRVPGTIMTIGGKQMVRNADGSWKPNGSRGAAS